MLKKSKEFQELQSLWYNKLKQDGFKDQETNERHLKWSTTSQVRQNLRKSGELGNSIKQNYFRLVGYFLYEYRFSSPVDRAIWQYHADGKSLREISRLLKQDDIKMAITQVKETVHRLRAQMYKKYKDLDND